MKRVLARVRQDDGRPSARRRALRRHFAQRAGWWAAAAVLVFGAGVTLFMRADLGPRIAETPEPIAIDSETSVVQASLDPTELGPDRLVEQQFTIDNGQARQVALVGDFNQWNPRRHRLHRDGRTRWVIKVQLPAGLHKYAFIVNDSVWTPDPSAVRTIDRDFGVTSSLVLVQ
ncbi:MAG TPA: glycogen-binding domain-containing protein [Gemmatimonadaceae bacterium]|nr:glycogen-binding domain-containing protein [Gemmatimonadaceae bacterium]